MIGFSLILLLFLVPLSPWKVLGFDCSKLLNCRKKGDELRSTHRRKNIDSKIPGPLGSSPTFCVAVWHPCSLQMCRGKVLGWKRRKISFSCSCSISFSVFKKPKGAKVNSCQQVWQESIQNLHVASCFESLWVAF